MADARLSRDDMTALTASAIRKVHTRGQRGLEMITHDEILALIGTVLDLGAEALMTSQKTGTPT